MPLEAQRKNEAELEIYTLLVKTPWRLISRTFEAPDDMQAAHIATEMVSATCAEIAGVETYQVQLKRSNGSEVFAPLSISALITNGMPTKIPYQRSVRGPGESG